MGKIAKKSLHKNIISKGGGVVHWRPQVDHGHPQERGAAYIVPAGGGGGARLCAPLEKKFCYMLGIFITFLYVGGPFCYVFLFVGAARALTPVQMFVGGGGGGRQAQKRPP